MTKNNALNIELSAHACESAEIAKLSHIAAQAVMERGKIRFDLLGREWILLRPADLESLWESITDEEFAEDERLPYWVELWPASLALAVWLSRQRNNIKGRVCLDLGCGLGFTALVGSWLGARVIGMDYESIALTYALQNTAANTLASPLWVAMDWRRPALVPGSCSFIWGGDIMYENRFVAPVFDFLDYALERNGTVWIAEPGRNTYTLFKNTLIKKGWISRCVADNSVEALHTQRLPVSVKLWELSRG